MYRSAKEIEVIKKQIDRLCELMKLRKQLGKKHYSAEIKTICCHLIHRKLMTPYRIEAETKIPRRATQRWVQKLKKSNTSYADDRGGAAFATHIKKAFRRVTGVEDEKELTEAYLIIG